MSMLFWEGLFRHTPSGISMPKAPYPPSLRDEFFVQTGFHFLQFGDIGNDFVLAKIFLLSDQSS